MICWKCHQELVTGDMPGTGLCRRCLAGPAEAVMGSIWNLTQYMRWEIRKIPVSELPATDVWPTGRTRSVLQQLWRNELGQEEWRDVPSIIAATGSTSAEG